MKGRNIKIVSSLSPSIFQYLADIVAFACSFGFYFFVRFYSSWFGRPNFDPDWISSTLVFFALLGYWLLIFWFSGLYKNWYVRSPFDELFAIVRVTFFGSVVLMLAIFLDDAGRIASMSRLKIFLFWAAYCSSVCACRLAVRSVQRALREKKIIQIPVIVVGIADKIIDLVQNLHDAPALGYQPMGVVLSNSSENVKWSKGKSNPTFDLPVLGIYSQMREILHKVSPQEVIVSADSANHEDLLQIVAECTNQNITVKIAPDLYEIFSGQARTMQIYGTPLIEVSTQLMKPWEEFAKRTLDIIFSICVLILGFPVLLAVGLAVKFTSPGGMFFAQERVGKRGKPFIMFKFRSMRTDAEKNGPQWAKVNDPRVTLLGRFIRKTHLDELPQFWNVLKGEMSLVGPRPERPFFVEKFTKEISYYPRRLSVRPGITGWWQIKYINYDDTIDEVKNRLLYDFFYIENMSFKLDLEIIVRTVFRMFKGHGQA